MSFDRTRLEYTVFTDWSGQEFEFDGVPDSITAQTENNKTWLVFHLQDEQGKFVGEKRLLFNDVNLNLSNTSIIGAGI